ncbi:hypothetical protein PT974_01744 [Cladobotryum mycophilum]|uniref:Uncharacterized protein n=1 Tax=Cladobotryum mycophilum TaxID=491253 RepID=A0ABR0SX95_9HYPO
MASQFPKFDTVLVPMQLDAFVLNPAVCGTGADDDTTARISPITQPNYTFLRLDKFLLQSDVQNHTDLHNTAPASVNPRMTDLGARPIPQPLRHRHGVYIHWMLPRFYRTGISSGQTVPPQARQADRLSRGLAAAPDASDGDTSHDTPDFVEPPTRWIVIRKLDINSVQPPEAQPAFADREYEGWVVESDHLWSLEDIPTDMDLQTDLAPFVVGQAGSNVNIDQQAEVFIGRKTPLASWSGQEDPKAQPPNISVLRSGNQLFADFQMHNTNVFSMLDNFEYGTDDAPQYLTYAKASYYVVGWHWKEDVDPLWNSGQTVPHNGSLKALLMNLQGVNQEPPNPDPWLTQMDQLRILCHGAMYEVTWDHENKPKDVPADRLNARLRDQTQAAVSVGTTPMDAMISYCSARKDHPEGPGDIAQLEEDILAIESLLYTRDDGVEEQRQAKDKIYNWSFTRSPGGQRYYFSGQDGDGNSDKQPLEPERPAILKLRELNQNQRLLDACSSSIQQYRWDMFSLWWKYVSDIGNSDSDANSPQNVEYKLQVQDLATHISQMQLQMQTIQGTIDSLLAPPGTDENLLATAKPASMPVFYRGNDPTLLIGGVESGWALDYLENVSVRAPFQTIAPKNGSSDLPPDLNDFLSLTSKLPDVFKNPVQALITEFYLLRPGGGDSGTADAGKFYPQFHDNRTTDQRWRDQWGDRQPWFPLFAEWEIEYTHIPFNYWKLDEHTARLSANKLARYGITVPPTKEGDTPPLWQALANEQGKYGPDTRVISGRVLILPQPSFSLQAKVAQLFQNTPPAILDQYLTAEERSNLLGKINELAYLSSPLSGLVNGLTTRAQGSHIKPENKMVGPEGESSSAIDEAVIEAIGLTKENIELIQGNSALTPYASLANFLDNAYSPFKPATHGQFRFRKLNIIDKFGQALMAIDQKPRTDGPPPIYPCISDFYEPQTVTIDGQVHANTVIQDDPSQCEFLQLPPQINQNARLNAEFVMRIADDPPDMNNQPAPSSVGASSGSNQAKWRPATEWENPIWGWVITNYADYGLQLFLKDGTFFREVRFGGPLGALESPKWLPFKPEDSVSTPETRQLDALATQLSNPAYLNGFWHMVTTAQANLAAAPTAYSQFLNSIVGKPLALVNMGFSLELDSPPLVDQSTKSNIGANPELSLVKPSQPDDKNPFYQLQVRLGDPDAEYDGLVGYFDTTAPDTDELKLDTIKTFFAPDQSPMTPLELLSTDNYPQFTPFWEAPFPTEPPYNNPSFVVDPATFDDRRNAHLSVFGTIIDPFTPVQAYSSFLPPVSLSLPSWTWQKAMNTMTAFFHAGPLTVPLNDVPAYDATQLLTVQNATDIPKRDLPLPSLGPGDWSWFQPYADSSQPASGGSNTSPPQGDDTAAPQFNPFGIQKTGNLNKPGFQKGPYTAIEGFLQLRNPIMMPTTKSIT